MLIYCKKGDCLNVYYPSSVIKYSEISINAEPWNAISINSHVIMLQKGSPCTIMIQTLSLLNFWWDKPVWHPHRKHIHESIAGTETGGKWEIVDASTQKQNLRHAEQNKLNKNSITTQICHDRRIRVTNHQSRSIRIRIRTNQSSTTSQSIMAWKGRTLIFFLFLRIA